jgi:hypothetical protein
LARVTPNWIAALLAEYRDPSHRLLIDGQPQDDVFICPHVRRLERCAVDLGQNNGFARQFELFVLSTSPALGADGEGDDVLVGIERFDRPPETRPFRTDSERRCKVGHNSWSPAFEEKEFWNWIFAQKRKPKK